MSFYFNRFSLFLSPACFLHLFIFTHSNAFAYSCIFNNSSYLINKTIELIIIKDTSLMIEHKYFLFYEEFYNQHNWQ